MNNALKITLLILIALSFVLLTGCDKTQLQDPVNSEDVDSLEKTSDSITLDEYDCYGWAVWSTKLRQYSKVLGYIPTQHFSKTDTSSEACIIEWKDNHAGYISYKTAEYIYVSEWWDHEVQYNYYYPPNFTHPDAGNVEFWWKKDPQVSLSVNISGPTELEPAEADDFTAYPNGGAGTYANYKWWKRNDGGTYSSEQEKDKKKR